MPTVFYSLNGKNIPLPLKISLIFLLSFILSSISFASEKESTKHKKKKPAAVAVSSKKKSKRKVAQIENKESKETIEAEIKSVGGEIDAGRKALDKVSEAREETKSDNKEAQRKLEKTRAERDQLRREYEAVLIDDKKLKNGALELRRQEKNEALEIQKLQKAVQAAKQSLEKTSALADVQKYSLKQAQDSSQKLKNSLADLQSQKEKYLNAIAANQAEQKKLADDIAASKNEIKGLSANLQDLKIRLKDVQNTHNLVAGTHKSTQADLGKWKQVNQGEEAKLKKVEDEISDLRRMIKVGQSEVDRAKEENEKLIKRRNNASMEKPKLEAHLNRLKMEYKMLKEHSRVAENRS